MAHRAVGAVWDRFSPPPGPKKPRKLCTQRRQHLLHSAILPIVIHVSRLLVRRVRRFHAIPVIPFVIRVFAPALAFTPAE